MLKRYEQLLTAIDLYKPRSIVEIGTWSGVNAIRMIQRAQKNLPSVKIQYIGYDLFEEASATTDAEELNVKKHHGINEVEGRIKDACPDACITLYKGNTRDVLHIPPVDFCFIDGGHSLETIANDHAKCSGSSVIIHDDFYIADEDGKIPNIELYGCNKLVSQIGGWVLPFADKVAGGGYVQMVQCYSGPR